MARGRKSTQAATANPLFPVEDYRHDEAKRTNIPPATIAAEGKVPVVPKVQYAYSPRLDPVLRFDETGKADRLPDLLLEAQRRPLTTDEARLLADALRNHEPWLEWAGKREAKGFAVDPVALHIHERISAEAILKVAARQDVTRDLFADPQHDYQKAVQFYRHEMDWTNRLILGDSLQVMASLAQREDLAGKVQMIYVDPPYGVRFGSNFQTEIDKKEVNDAEQRLTREAEMVRAYRDTWSVGIHSYLRYLKDRLIIAKQLLMDSGSIFVQISDENFHYVRTLMDEIYGRKNSAGIIQFKKTGFAATDRLATICDYLLWYGKDLSQTYVTTLFEQRKLDTKDTAFFDRVETPLGDRRPLTDEERDDPEKVPADCKILARNPLVSPGYAAGLSQAIEFCGRFFSCPPNRHYSTTPLGIMRLIRANRIIEKGNVIRLVRYFGDYAVTTPTNTWLDLGTGGFVGDQKRYAVQTDSRIVQRCILMTTKPGDLVLDPTCGGGTTAYVAEQWGRRWVTIDTSRVAIAISRQRLLTAKFDYYEFKDEANGVSGGFRCKTAPHITLKSIAQNANLDPIFANHEPVMNARLADLNKALAVVPNGVRQGLAAKLLAKQKAEGKRAISDADRRRWDLPKQGQAFQHWTVPFDTDPDHPKPLADAITAYRGAWRAKMNEVNACIAANADPEELVDQPVVKRAIVRVSGPFTVEAMQPPEISLGQSDKSPISGEPEPAEETFATGRDGESAAANAEAYLDQMLRLLRMDGVRFPDNKQMRFIRLEPATGKSTAIHAEGRWVPEGETDPDPEGNAEVCVAFGPQYGPVTAKQVEQLIRAAYRRGYSHLVIAGFNFDGPAQAAIDEADNPEVQVHMAHIRPDVNPAMNGLLKEQPGSQLFTVFGQPRTRLDGPDPSGEYTVTMEGVDIYDPVTNKVDPTRADKVAAWFLDTDYDGRTFCITQAFFPDRTAWEKLAKALDRVIDVDRFEAFAGTVSLPFPPGENGAVAVKVIDPRGNEVMRVHRLGA